MYYVHNYQSFFATRLPKLPQNSHNRCVQICFINFIILFLAIHFPSISFSAYIDLPRDVSGWTVFTPSTDSTIVYVSSSGNDSTCVGYLPNNPLIGPDPFNPVGAIQPCRTYSAAYAKTHPDMPDWVLIKRGDTFVGSVNTEIRSGRSATEPFLIGAYGSTGLAPIFKVPSTVCGYRPTGSKRWTAISGITFYASTRDLSSPDYVDSTGQDGLFAYANSTNVLQDILVEGCKFLYFINNQVSGVTFGLNVRHFTIYRCVFANSYSETSHSQGFYSDQLDGLVLEENIFDHNGWLIQSTSSNERTGGQATMFNHNIYISGGKNLIVKNNVFLRPSSMQNKFTANYGEASAENILIENNLYVDGEGGISIGGNTTTPLRFKDITIKDNVMTNMNISHPTNRNLAYAIEIHDWDGGEVKNNYILNTNEINGRVFWIIGTSRNVSIKNNIVYEFKNNIFTLNLSNLRGSDVSNMSFTDNTILVSSDAGYTIDSEYDPSGKWTISGNKYFSSRTDGTRFRLLNSTLADSQWASITGDNSNFAKVSYPEPSRDIATYMSAMGENGTIDAFIIRCREQDRYRWNKKFTADQVNGWIKLGFGGIQSPKEFRTL